MTDLQGHTSKRPGRKAETPGQRLQRLERDLKAAKQAMRDAEQRTFATIGSALMAEADGDAEFKMKLRDILRRRVTSKTAKADIAAVLAE